MKSSNFLSQELEELTMAVKENIEKRTYYDANKDIDIRYMYYKSISFDDNKLINSMHRLLDKTHTEKLNYSPHRYVYPWVDLQENGKLKSLYSGKGMEPAAVIEHDIRLLELRKSGFSAFSGTNLLNCEHVVPQSWFNKKEPMRGDLHHLFACEPGCNSCRGNNPYFDFTDYIPETQILGVKEGCGKAEDGHFEPEYGKGIVARATLYFLIRYINLIDSKNVNIPLLIKWHNQFSVSVYEKHRNLAVYELQGNRNPFIDYPEMAEKMLGL
ncbi:endonuclease I [Peribacillus saganii]|uniref:Endonuclease I n=1 Tax=Peribacillus saganii TaxID=2303992 RepID=A0A372LDU8_9BACI|nr:endonuclease [Peribacillus saganii]RFU64392.1 endonuclease I [Peribacillus saganii]